MSNSALNELGFAEFVAKLISDTFGAVLASQIEQQDKITELTNLLSLSEDEFVAMCMQDDDLVFQLEENLKQRYPFDSDTAHAVYKGAPYQPPTQQKEEQPPFFNDLGISLEEKLHFSGKKLTEEGAKKIKKAVMLNIAQKQRQLLSDVLINGIPKLSVDHGKINAKLTFSMKDEGSQEEEDESNSAPSNNAVITNNFAVNNLSVANRFAGVIDTSKLIKTRLNITPASNRAPQDAQSSANIYSEVEIHFKSIL
ncbi:hypothetical protein KUL152_00610 [Tenacibaculum sp. KUL152]|nr:hypothetical protein KUL152_00610 [Tenacibaculum sp. KUL152]